MYEEIDCTTCAIVNEYVRLAGNFTEDLTEILVPAMSVLFASVVALWIVWQGIRVILGSLDLAAFGREFIFIAIAGALLGAQGAELVNALYTASLSTISGAAATVLSVGVISEETGITFEDYKYYHTNSEIAGLTGLTALVQIAERGVFGVFMKVETVIQSHSTLAKPGAMFTGFFIVLPYAILLIVYFAQVVVTIFRVMAICTFSPILMLMVGFNFGRGMPIAALRSLFASFMVLFGATIALAVCLYGVASLGVSPDPTDLVPKDLERFFDWNNPQLWVTIMLGWLGTAFMAEATSLANSITSASLTNQAATIITAGASATGWSAFRYGKSGASQAFRKGAVMTGDAYDAMKRKYGGGEKGTGDNAGSDSRPLDPYRDPSIDRSDIKTWEYTGSNDTGVKSGAKGGGKNVSPGIDRSPIKGSEYTGSGDTGVKSDAKGGSKNVNLGIDRSPVKGSENTGSGNTGVKSDAKGGGKNVNPSNQLPDQ